MTHPSKPIITLLAILILAITSRVYADATQLRMDRDLAAGKPIVIHVSVALADNRHQWIVPVPDAIGNGRDARINLYWGARYGIKTYLMRDGHWQKVASTKPEDDRILERLVLKNIYTRQGRNVDAFLVADAWDGRYIRDTIGQFLNHSAGRDKLQLPLKNKTLSAGGSAHLIVYIGYNALMDLAGVSARLQATPLPATGRLPTDAIVLACKSAPYFKPRLARTGAHPLVLTTGLMAPEAYTLHAAIQSWIAGGSDTKTREAAAKAYASYQKTGPGSARRLFGLP